MPRRSRKLPIASAGSKPDVNINWGRIENAYGQAIPDSVRTAVLEATREFLSWEILERSAEPAADAEKSIKAYKKAAGNLQRVMLSGPQSDARVYARHLIRRHFQDSRLSGQLDPFHSLAGVLTSFAVACQKALSELEPPASTQGLLGDLGALPSFEEGEAWDEWIRRLSKIMKDAELPWRVRKDDGKSKHDRASPFIRFLWELQQCLPDACKLPYAKSALATATARARRKTLRVSSSIRSAKSGHKSPLSNSE